MSMSFTMFPNEIVSLQKLAEGFGLMFRMPNDSVVFLVGENFVVDVDVDMDGAFLWYYDVTGPSDVKEYALGFLLFRKRYTETVQVPEYANNQERVQYQLQVAISVLAEYGSDVLSGSREWFSENIWNVSDCKGGLRDRIVTALAIRTAKLAHENGGASSPANGG
jgi:hypothetical protein